ncbi:NAD(P)H-dependent oxidoreductase [Bacillus paralicheniformis]|uniref:NAD(P)H-dependent oxidoreductase n=1 Tax=Bacillus paralicheniformis TaxID=1648923 RepID=UPI00224474A6|nr:NAD(P)H-dependent oxidoreductase [Bacillus paralicheniformis]MEC1023649.1 NAD(P)H-dependent oxidoreductase [Bacillus paralicheniformis]MEC1025428.1 NAD(P)H-dependent oxidoreductase [Bacillus paralicheniformis]MEC1036803.1 NAD(P)H-dependent oxidoreductase [Bacillus paralicheniformis]MEC1052208.1 NAD(P)H-dependent oxidoreductase [Bacillus paralicheniformis]MEC1060869.1 NAD(P)H-dependent oxidoreductase [Bacillus paralicheniformis]
MQTAVIYAHPNPNSFNGAILNQVIKALEDGKHSYDVIDLYKDRFDPVLLFDEKKRRSDMKRDPETAEYRRIVKNADHLIFIYPLWWGGMPAIMKGFIDRVFAAGEAYTYQGKLPKGLLKACTATVYYTADAPSWYLRFWRRDADWVTVKDVMLKFCGVRRVKRLLFAGVKDSSEEKRTQWLDRVYRSIAPADRGISE